jgi:hypothetical protein
MARAPVLHEIPPEAAEFFGQLAEKLAAREAAAPGYLERLRRRADERRLIIASKRQEEGEWRASSGKK